MESELEQINAWKDQIIVYVTTNGVSVLLGIAIIVIGFWIAGKISDLVLKICNKKQLDITLSGFFAGFCKVAVIAIACIIGLEKAGIEITPFIALLGASAFGLSLAVQGPISNYGAGIVLILTRPFKVDDTLAVAEVVGIVESINLGSTKLINEDEELITIPNRKVLGEIFTNSYHFKVVEATVGIEYAADPEKAIEVISQAINQVKGIAPDRAPDVGIEGFGDSSIDIGYRVWVPTAKYHTTRYTINLAVYHALKNAQITIPFPQRDIRMIQPSNQ